MQITCNLNNTILKQLITAVLLIAPLQLISAADDPVTTQLSSTRIVMQQLDQLASVCLANEPEITNSQELSCQAFQESLNGELLETYLSNCQAIKSWREQFVSDQSNNSAPVEDASESLELMIEAEFLCGDNALLKRTEYVELAYRKLNNSSASGFNLANRSSRELREFQQDLLISRERERLRNTFQQQQLRQRQETQNQINRQELEYIRQQNDQLNRR
jgi:hypothetical protein